MHLLLVEDEAALAAATRMGLEAAGFTVDVVGDGDTGYQAALEQRHDLIILDILLPGRNGFALCRDIRNAEVWTPIIMLTAKSGAYDEAEALELGADDFMSKPFELVVLVARIRALLRRRDHHPTNELRYGTLELDPDQRRCRHRGTDITLTEREFQLLAELVRAHGEVRSRQALLDAVWGPDFAGEPTIVEVYISYLRSKLDDPGLITTIRKLGYRLNDTSDNDTSDNDTGGPGR